MTTQLATQEGIQLIDQTTREKLLTTIDVRHKEKIIKKRDEELQGSRKQFISDFIGIACGLRFSLQELLNFSDGEVYELDRLVVDARKYDELTVKEHPWSRRIIKKIPSSGIKIGDIILHTNYFFQVAMSLSGVTANDGSRLRNSEQRCEGD